MKSAGNYETAFSASALSSGVYLYTLEAVGIDGSVFIETRKMSVLK
jgi:hypothetical protein